jgi:hypothetical protein
MKSKKTGNWFLTGEFTSHQFNRFAVASQVSEVLGLSSVDADTEAIQAELDRVARNRAALVKDIADAILPAIASGATVSAEVDAEAIARAVEAQLVDEFAAVNDNINRPRTVS